MNFPFLFLLGKENDSAKTLKNFCDKIPFLEKK